MVKGYKASNVGTIPEDWDCEVVENLITEISMGPFGSDIKVENFTTEGIPVLNGYNVSSLKLIDEFHNYVTPSKAKSLKKAVAHRGDIVITHRGTIGQVSYIPYDSEYKEYVISQSQFRVRFNQEKVNSHFVVSYFLSDKGQKDLLEKRGHTGVPALAQPTTNFRKLSIPLPKIEEQIEITKALSDIDELIYSLEMLIKKKKAIRKGTIQELITGKKRLPGFDKEWRYFQMSEIGTIVMGQSPDSKYYNDTQGVPLVQGNADIKNRKTIIRFYTTVVTKSASRGDIIFTVRAPVGNVAYATFDCCLGRGVCAIKNSSPFVFHLLVYKQDSWSDLSSGSTFDSINSNTLKKVELYMPTDEKEREAIADVLSEIDLEIESLDNKLEKYHELKSGMVNELLTGKIRLV